MPTVKQPNGREVKVGDKLRCSCDHEVKSIDPVVTQVVQDPVACNVHGLKVEADPIPPFVKPGPPAAPVVAAPKVPVVKQAPKASKTP
jgi:hypothetical protein